MIEVYKIYGDDIDKHVATIYYNQTTKLYSCELIIPDKTPLLFARCESGIHPGECLNPPQECIDFWLRDRVIPENRQMLKEILHANNKLNIQEKINLENKLLKRLMYEQDKYGIVFKHSIRR